MYGSTTLLIVSVLIQAPVCLEDVVVFRSIMALDANILDVLARSATTISIHVTLNFASTVLEMESVMDQ